MNLNVQRKLLLCLRQNIILAKNLTTKLSLTMKLTAFLMVIASLQISAKTFSQKITLSVKNTPLREVLQEIRKQSGYKLVYNTDLLQKSRPVSISVQDATINETLYQAMSNQPFQFEIEGNIILINPLSPKAEQAFLIRSQQQVITGKVSDATGALVGASVSEKDTKNVVRTNAKGEYSIKLENQGSTLIFSYIGYMTQAKAVGSQTVLNVILKEDENLLSGVVVTGMETIKRKLFTGATQTLKMDQIKLDGATDITGMLQGRAAGVNVQNISGTFGAAPKISIRGGSSIKGQTAPLWVIDGVVREDIVEQTTNDLTSGNAETLIGSTVAGINTNDIESIDILRDASATSLYGARAMNGVIVITTKKGRRDTPTAVTYTGEFSVRQTPSYNQFDILNSYENMGILTELKSKGFLNQSNLAGVSNSGVYGMAYDKMNTYDPITKTFQLGNTDQDLNRFLQKYEMANTDWFSTLFRPSLMNNHTLTFSGGGAKNGYYASVGYLNDPGWTKADKVDQLAVNFKNTFYFSDKVNLTLSTLSSIRKQKAPGTLNSSPDSYFGTVTRDFDINPFSYALSTSRVLRPYDENGNLEYYRKNFAPFNILNEIENNYMDINVKDFQFQADFKYKITDKIDFSSIGSARFVNSEREVFALEKSNRVGAYRSASTALIRENNRFLYRDPDVVGYIPTVAIPNGGIYSKYDNSLTNYYLRNTLHYYDKFNGKHDLDILAAQEMRYIDRGGSSFTGFGMQFDDGYVPYTDISILKKAFNEGINYFEVPAFRERSVAFLGKATYGFLDKYVISASGRYDGSNRQGEASSARWLPTWTVSGKWDLYMEKFMQDFNKSIDLSALQFRASYGLTANTGPATNAYTIYKNNVSINRVNGADRESVINISELANRYLTWEKQYSANLGLDLGFLNNRITVSTDVYQKKSFDLIDDLQASGIGGELLKTANNADMTTRGIEVAIQTTNITNGDFSWQTTLNFDHFKQKITKLEVRSSVFDLVQQNGGNSIGYPRGSLFSLNFVGLNDKGLPQFKVKDAQGDLITVSDVNMQDRNNVLSYLVNEGSVDPNMTMGLSNNFKYKNWGFSFFLYGSTGNKIRKTPIFSSSYTEGFVPTKDFANRWLLAGDELRTNVPVIADQRLLAEDGNLARAYNSYNFSTAQVADGTFLRLRNVALSYKLNETLVRRIGLNNVSVRLAATNPWLIYSDKKLNGADPEFYNVGGVAQPVSKQYILSLNIGI